MTGLIFKCDSLSVALLVTIFGWIRITLALHNGNRVRVDIVLLFVTRYVRVVAHIDGFNTVQIRGWIPFDLCIVLERKRRSHSRRFFRINARERSRVFIK